MKKFIIATLAVFMLVGNISPQQNIVQAETVEQSRQSQIQLLTQLLQLLQSQLQILLAQNEVVDIAGSGSSQVFSPDVSVKQIPVELKSDVNYNSSGSGAFVQVTIDGKDTNKNLLRWDYKIICEGDLHIEGKAGDNLCGREHSLYESGYYDSTDDNLILTLPVNNKSQKKSAKMTIQVSAFDWDWNKIGYDEVVVDFNKEYSFEEPYVVPANVFGQVKGVDDIGKLKVHGTAKGVNVVGFSIGGPGGDKAYGSGDVSVVNGEWEHFISENLPSGKYQINLRTGEKQNYKGLDTYWFDVGSSQSVVVTEALPQGDFELLDLGTKSGKVDNLIREYKVSLFNAENNQAVSFWEMDVTCDKEIVNVRFGTTEGCDRIHTILGTSTKGHSQFILGVTTDKNLSGLVEIKITGYEEVKGKDEVVVKVRDLTVVPAKG